MSRNNSNKYLLMFVQTAERWDIGKGSAISRSVTDVERWVIFHTNALREEELEIWRESQWWIALSSGIMKGEKMSFCIWRGICEQCLEQECFC